MTTTATAATAATTPPSSFARAHTWPPGQLPPLRPQQAIAVDAITELFNDYNLVVVDAPVGAGKTILGEAVRRRIASHTRSLYICTSRLLQDQVLGDPTFADARLLKGRRNYFPLTSDPRKRQRMKSLGDVTCEDCTSSPAHPDCAWCDDSYACPYREAREKAMAANLAIINTSYWLTEANHAGKFGRRSRYLAIVDEADLLDEAVTQVAEVRISAKRLRRLGWDPPPHSTTGPRTTIAWRSWIEDHLPELEGRLRDVERLIRIRRGDHRADGTLLQHLRERAWLQNTIEGLQLVHADLAAGKDSGWLRTGDVDTEACWTPVWPSTVADRLLWQHATKWLLMSATVLSAQEMVERLGWKEPWAPVTVPSTFPPENRPIHFLPVANMSRKSPPEEQAKMVAAIRAIVEKAHPQDRCLVHTVTYDLARAVCAGLQGLGRSITMYSKADDAALAVENFKLEERSVLVACSQERGLDLPDDLCRCVIVAKTPFGNLGDPLIKVRAYDRERPGQQWYSLEALRRLVQMTGRHVRHEEDFGTSYILDSQFLSLWRNVRYYAPRWWTEALKIDRIDPDLMRLVGLIK